MAKAEVRKLRGPFNAMVAAAMRRDGIPEITKWADHWNIGRTTLYNLLSGREAASGVWVKPSLDTLSKLSHALKRPLHELVYILEPDALGAGRFAGDPLGSMILEGDYQEPPRATQVPIQIAGWCGAGPEQEVLVGDKEVFVPHSFAAGKELVAFEVHGDSMAAGSHPIHHLDIVIVNRKDKGYDGAAVVARLEDGYVCKLLKDDRFGKNLYSRNADYTNGTPPAIPIEQVVELVGRVVRVIANAPTPPDPKELRRAA